MCGWNDVSNVLKFEAMCVTVFFADVHTVGVYTMEIVVRHRLYGDACDVCQSETFDCIGRYRLHLGYEFGLWHE